MNRQQRRSETRSIEKKLKSYTINKELKALSNDKALLETTACTVDKESGRVTYLHNDDMKLLNEKKHTNEVLQKKFNRLVKYFSRIRSLENRLQYLKVGYKAEPTPVENSETALPDSPKA